MRVVVTGASGNVGTSLLRALAAEPEVESVLGIVRRPPRLAMPKLTWRPGDILDKDLARNFEGADAVVHLAWLIQPSRDRAATRRANVGGSEAVFEAAARAQVKTIVYASSVGAYSPGPNDDPVDESWPVEGVESSFYARDKAEVESLLDRFEAANQEVRVVRMRPALMFKREAATEIRRLFVGPFAPRFAFDRRAIPVVPRIPGLRFQALHTDDAADAFRRALLRPVSGAFNLAADPVLDPDELARALGARTVPVPARPLRALVTGAWRARLIPTPPGWLDLALATPLMSTDRARRELEWEPTHTSVEALLELLDGMRHGAGIQTPPLDPESSGPLRVRELRTGVGRRGF